MRQDTDGYIVVETIGCFTLFVFLMISILSLVNVVVVQARMHYAMTQAAETVSMYSYTLCKTGVAQKLTSLAGKSDKVEDKINGVQEAFNQLVDGVEKRSPGQIESSGRDLYNQVDTMAQEISADPKGMLQNFLSFAAQQGEDALFSELVSNLIKRYLVNGERSGEEYLKAFNVVDGDFDVDGRLLTADGNVRIRVSYEIDYTFGALPLPFTRLSITQEVMTKAWLNGLGEGY